MKFILIQIKHELLTSSLRKEDDKEKVSNMRQSQLEESMKHKEILKEKEENIAQQQISLSEAVIQVKNRDLEVKHLSSYIGKCNIL